MKIRNFVFAVFILMLLALPMLAMAQDTAPAPDASGSIISLSTLLYGVVIAIVSGGTVVGIINLFGSNKANLDALEKLYQSQPPEAQERQHELFLAVKEVTERVLDVLDKITDGKPNSG